MVDEAKAFCLSCGNAFVDEEERRDASKFDKVEHTVQFGQTMYNQMLEDMGLDISGLSKSAEKRVEVIAPVVPEVAVPSENPNATVARQPTQTSTVPATPAPSGNAKWYILIGLAVVFLLPIALWSTIFLALEILARLR